MIVMAGTVLSSIFSDLIIDGPDTHNDDKVLIKQLEERAAQVHAENGRVSTELNQIDDKNTLAQLTCQKTKDSIKEFSEIRKEDEDKVNFQRNQLKQEEEDFETEIKRINEELKGGKENITQLQYDYATVFKDADHYFTAKLKEIEESVQAAEMQSEKLESDETFDTYKEDLQQLQDARDVFLEEYNLLQSLIKSVEDEK